MQAVDPAPAAPTLLRAGELWRYLSSWRRLGKADAVVVCCSYDLRVCDHACALLARGLAETLLLSGAHGNWTRHLWSAPEAEVFAARARANGIDAARIRVEPRAANLGENVRFARALLPDAQAVIFVTKPNTLLRLRLTAAAQWPGVDALLSCPEIAFPDEVSNRIGLWGVIHEMVGDIDRILRYPALGYQAGHELPPRILDHWRALVADGFTAHLLDEPAAP